MNRLEINIDENLSKEATVILAEMGLTPSDAISAVMRSVVHDRTFPLDLFEPNEETKKAMRESLDAKPGDLPSFSTVEELMRDLNLD